MLNSPLSKKVLCEQNGIIYASAREAARTLKISVSVIVQQIKSCRKTKSGYTFKYI